MNGGSPAHGGSNGGAAHPKGGVPEQVPQGSGPSQANSGSKWAVSAGAVVVGLVGLVF